MHDAGIVCGRKAFGELPSDVDGPRQIEPFAVQGISFGGDERSVLGIELEDFGEFGKCLTADFRPGFRQSFQSSLECDDERKVSRPDGSGSPRDSSSWPSPAGETNPRGPRPGGVGSG